MTTTDLDPTQAEPTATEPSPTELLAGRLFSTGVGAVELCTVYLGVHLGLYRELDDSPATAAELAARTGCDERYLREWLQAQAVSGLLDVDGADPATARFALADGTHDVLVDETSPAYLGGLADVLAAAGRVLPLLVDAYRTGAGVPYAAYGPDGVSATVGAEPPGVRELPGRRVAAAAARRAGPAAGHRTDPARVADLGCGTGWAANRAGQGVPAHHAWTAGTTTRRRSRSAGATRSTTASRTGWTWRSSTWPTGRPTGRRGTTWRCSSSACTTSPGRSRRCDTLARPCGPAVRSWSWTSAPPRRSPRRATRSSGSSPRPAPIWCLPQGRVGPDPEPVGTLIRPDTMRDLARRAGYAGVDIVPIEHPFWRFYRLTP